MEVGANSNLGIPSWLIDRGCGLRSEKEIVVDVEEVQVDPLCVCRQSWFHFFQRAF